MFDFNDVKPYLSVQLQNELFKDVYYFNLIKLQAIEVVRRFVDIDDTKPLSKDLLLPTAWILSYIYIQTNNSMTEQERLRAEALYNNAIELLSKKRNEKSGYIPYSNGTIGGLNEW